MKRALSSYQALHRREGQCSTAVGGKQRLCAQRHPQDGQVKPLLNRSENVTSLSSPVREATVMTTIPSTLLRTGLCKPSSSSKTERPLFESLVTRAVISTAKHMVYAHTQTAALETTPLHGTAELGLCPVTAT